MLAAPAARNLGEEFGTQWLHVHGFSSIDEKNAELFPTFADLRADMEEETVRFLDDFFRNDRSILSLIDADHTFLNERLARHYGIEGVTGDAWRRVEGVRNHGRGSILGLATTLSTQAGASRTSPILRGNWLYETILGEKLPKPPKDVPLLAETVPAGLSERQLIAMHSENAACAKCHRRIDPFGFALEEFDAIGRLRTADASGKPLDTKATLPDGAGISARPAPRPVRPRLLPEAARLRARPWRATLRRAAARRDAGEAGGVRLQGFGRDRCDSHEPAIPHDPRPRCRRRCHVNHWLR
jgi:hypothetical protein